MGFLKVVLSGIFQEKLIQCHLIQLLNNLFKVGWSKKEKKCWHQLLYSDVTGLLVTSKFQKIQKINEDD